MTNLPDIYAIRLEPLAMQQLAKLDPAARARARGLLVELADLAAFASGLSLTVANMNSLIANLGEVTIHYVVDDARRSLTVTDLVEDTAASLSTRGGS